MNTESIKLASIRLDGGTQIRSQIDQARVASYQEKYESGVRMPFPVVFYDGSEYWLADGFHRVAAVRAVGWVDLGVDVRAGTRRDAILYAVGANEEHGAPRTNEDKRRAVETLLRDEEWAKWSNRKIAEACKVSPDMVDRLRKLSLPESGSEQVPETTPPTQRRFVTKHGTEATMNTSNIGKAPKEPRCIACGETDRAMFYGHPTSPSRCQSRCKQCDNAKRVENSKKSAIEPSDVDATTAAPEPEPEDCAPSTRHPSRKNDDHERVRSLAAEGYTASDIRNLTGLKSTFIYHALREARGPESVLTEVIEDTEAFGESWARRAANLPPRWGKVTKEEKAALVVALKKCRESLSKIINRLNKEANGDASVQVHQDQAH